MGDPAVVLHRFGGTYGAAKFLLTAAQEDMEGEIRVTLVNGWGVPVKVLHLINIQIRHKEAIRANIIGSKEVSKKTKVTKGEASHVRLIPSSEKETVPGLLIIDLEIARVWNQAPQDILVYENETLASLKLDELLTGKLLWRDIRWIESKDLFLPEFVFIDQEDALPGGLLPSYKIQDFVFIDQEDALPGGLLPYETQPLAFNGEPITPLIPLNPILLEYFTPEDLINKIQFTLINRSDQPLMRVTIDLPLAGFNDGKYPKNYRLIKDYPIKQENALFEVPVLDVWPNLKLKEGWQEYYAFYYDAEYGEETFQVSFPETREIRAFRDGRGSYQINRLEEFPSFVNCQDSSKNSLGLILLKTPEEIQPTSSWEVGVDFNTSFTNVYIKSDNIVKPLPLESLNLQITEAETMTRINVLFEYFIPDNFLPIEKPLPLENILTTRGSTITENQILQPVLDGRIYIPDRRRFRPQEPWVYNLSSFQAYNIHLILVFLQHLALHITAIAAKNKVQQIQWCISYPSSFSRNDRRRYAKVWKDLTRNLQYKTGINQICPDIDDLDYFRPQSLAVAQYFADYEQHNLVNTTCIYLGDGESDISIWEENRLIHQCSIQLGYRELFSQSLAMNPRLIEKIFNISLSNHRISTKELKSDLDNILRLEGDDFLKNRRILVEEKLGFQDLIQFLAIGIAGLYYYVGIILKVLHKEGKYSRREINQIYIAGKGSQLLHWLDISGHFNQDSEMNELLSYILSTSSGFPDTEEITRLSMNPQDEVACGLVLKDSRLTGLMMKKKEPLIAGENYAINGIIIPWSSRLETPDEIYEFKVPKLEQLSKFLYDFHIALQELNIENIKPLKGYNRSLDLNDNEKLWRDTSKELTNLFLKTKGDSGNIRLEPPFILGLKALLRTLAIRAAS
ncbi:MAG: hypothetical protein F6K31_41315 [Symploca sp. SIO2G7]|nr:hypothetical protein [Symploca sp. SIO2G7]